MHNTHNFPKIKGIFVNLREAEINDSKFILKLRTNPEKAKYINKTNPDLSEQIKYMENYKALDNEWYFIIEDKMENPIGTICIYTYPILKENWKNADGLGILGTGRWLMASVKSPVEGIEGDYLTKKFFFETLKLPFIPMYVHEHNSSVLNFQKKWGAKVVGWNEEIKHHLLELSKDDFNVNRKYFERILYGNKTYAGKY